MAKQVENSKGFFVIEMTDKEAKRIGFGIPDEGCICMHCNEIIDKKIYYIAVLNDCMCEDCYNDYMEDAHHYIEDSAIEKRNFDYVMYLLENNVVIVPQYPQIIRIKTYEEI